MGNTLKVKTTGRYGPRYGVGIRKSLLKIESKQRKYYQCPFCGAERVRRKAPGLYSCRKCSNTFTGGAYLPVTLPGSIVQKMVAQRSFLPSMKELLSTKEEWAADEEQLEGAESGADGKKEWGERASREIYRERRELRAQGKERREWKERKPEEKEIGNEKKELREHEEKEIGLGKEKIEGHKREEKEIGKEKKGKEKHKKETGRAQKWKEARKDGKKGETKGKAHKK